MRTIPPRSSVSPRGPRPCGRVPVVQEDDVRSRTAFRIVSALLTLAAVGAAAPPARADDGADAEARRRLRRTPVVEAVEQAAPSVVSVGTTQLVKVARYYDWWTRDYVLQEQPGALGSGVIVHPAGYVVTNAHVINRAAQISVKLTGLGQEREIPAKLLAVDLGHDLALLEMNEPGPYPAARFGRSDDLLVGETVIALGSPFGLGRTVSTGVISALDRDIPVQNQVFEGLIQTDAAVNPGNSGGALLNILGEWIGVNSAIYSASGGGSDGISFAIPIGTVREFLIEAMRPRRMARRWLGVEFGEAPDGTVSVARVYPVGPAADAGVQPGTVVVDADGRPARDLLRLTFSVLEAVPSGSYTLRLREGGETRTVALPFDELPVARLAWERLGLRTVEVTQEVTERTGYREGTGLLVAAVREKSPAERIGFQPNDLLVAVADERVTRLDDLLVLLEGLRGGETLDVHLLRPQETRFGRRVEQWKARLVAD